MALKYDPSSKNKSKYQARIEFARKELLKKINSTKDFFCVCLYVLLQLK